MELVIQRRQKAWKLMEKSELCKGTMAKDKGGRSCHIPSERAKQFSLLGAVYQSYHFDKARQYSELFARVKKAMRKLGHKQESIWLFENDPKTTRAMVVAVLKKADV